MKRVNSFKIGYTEHGNIYITYFSNWVFIVNQIDLESISIYEVDFSKIAYDYWESNITFKDVDINKSIDFCKEFFDNFEIGG